MTPPKKIRLVVADDHTVFRAGLKLLLEAHDDMEVIGEVADTHHVLDEVVRLRPDVLILDLTMPGGSSVPHIEKIRRAAPETRILVLSMHDDLGLVRAVLASGASGYVVKAAADTEVAAAIRTVASGKIFVDLDLDPTQVGSLLVAERKEPAGKVTGPLEGLSDREKAVFTRLAKGHTNQEIADELELSVKTIETYRGRIGVKLGLRSRADFVRFAIELGLIGPESYSSDSA
ncbi:response regulator transcription factor [Blastopirellula sp. JC732]|uniref:Response regulator transcription factor n=1 Tax=Blastopirellula sediminis TaxID=2894196 RepID=A0A9X1SDZ3_9BACT|nr:response regulator transcription factor [Blastopirellula sediminis]MCC9607987.1 response regulator transcription factor [Blastopirellula sediminis]MCC9627220.1 response regulator transcription factor [Blastopirellula sediminis]